MTSGDNCPETISAESKRSMPSGRHAIVRGVPETYDRCVRPAELDHAICIHTARRQHDGYCRALEGLGLELIRLEADDSFPDCCFVEDPAIVVGDNAIIACMGAESRRGEEAEMSRALAEHKKILHIQPPATLEGGDVLRIDHTLYVGLSRRTNRAAVEQLQQLLAGSAFEVVPVPVRNALHLKTACTYLGRGFVIVASECIDASVFAGYTIIPAPSDEAYSANCLSVNGKVIIPARHPKSKRVIQEQGFEMVEVEMSEFQKGDGGLTCLSKIF